MSSLVYSSRADGGVEGAQTEACEAWAAAHGPGIARVRGTDRPWPAWSRFGADPGGSKVEMWCFRHRGVTLPIYYFAKKGNLYGEQARYTVQHCGEGRVLGSRRDNPCYTGKEWPYVSRIVERSVTPR